MSEVVRRVTVSDEGLLKIRVIKKAPSRDADGRSERADLAGHVRERWISGSFSGGVLTTVGGRVGLRSGVHRESPSWRAKGRDSARLDCVQVERLKDDKFSTFLRVNGVLRSRYIVASRNCVGRTIDGAWRAGIVLI